VRPAAGLLVAAAALACGCGQNANSTSTGGSTITVYSLLPLQGRDAPVSHDIVDGEKLALQQVNGQVGTLTVNYRSVDTSAKGRVDAIAAARAARVGAQDISAIAAIGALDPVEARVEIPLLNEASIGLVTTAVTDPTLRSTRIYPSGAQTFSAVVGNAESQARTLAALARRRCRRAAVLAGTAPQDRALAALVVGAAPGARRVSLADARAVPAGSCVILAASTPAPAVAAVRVLRAPRGVYAPYALASARFTRPVTALVPAPPAGAGTTSEFARVFGRRASPDVLLGHAAMQSVLSAVRAAGRHGNDRAAVARELQRIRPLPWRATTAR